MQTFGCAGGELLVKIKGIIRLAHCRFERWLDFPAEEFLQVEKKGWHWTSVERGTERRDRARTWLHSQVQSSQAWHMQAWSALLQRAGKGSQEQRPPHPTPIQAPLNLPIACAQGEYACMEGHSVTSAPTCRRKQPSPDMGRRNRQARALTGLCRNETLDAASYRVTEPSVGAGIGCLARPPTSAPVLPKGLFSALITAFVHHIQSTELLFQPLPKPPACSAPDSLAGYPAGKSRLSCAVAGGQFPVFAGLKH